jgi:hypothetical protein
LALVEASSWIAFIVLVVAASSFMNGLDDGHFYALHVSLLVAILKRGSLVPATATDESWYGSAWHCIICSPLTESEGNLDTVFRNSKVRYFDQEID